MKTKVCDFCNVETTFVEGCAVCRRDACDGLDNVTLKPKHWAYSFEIYRYSDGKRAAGHGAKICNECAENVKAAGSVRGFMNGLMWGVSKGPSSTSQEGDDAMTYEFEKAIYEAVLKARGQLGARQLSFVDAVFFVRALLEEGYVVIKKNELDALTSRAATDER